MRHWFYLTTEMERHQVSKESTQIRHLLKSPKAQMDFAIRRKLPNTVKPTSPLITYLEAIPPRKRIEIKNVRLSPKLGYLSGAQFPNAQALLSYLKPSGYMIGSWPAESARIKQFSRPITDELFFSVQQR